MCVGGWGVSVWCGGMGCECVVWGGWGVSVWCGGMGCECVVWGDGV